MLAWHVEWHMRQKPKLPLRGHERRRDLALPSMSARVKSGGKRISDGDQVRSLCTLITVAMCIADAEPSQFATRPAPFQGKAIRLVGGCHSVSGKALSNPFHAIRFNQLCLIYS